MKLVTPGPVPISDAIQKTLAKPSHFHHRSESFKVIFRSVLEGLKVPFQTRNHVFILMSSGTGAMEASLVNTLSAKDEVVVISSGKFGQRWVEMAQSFGLKVHRLEVAWGKKACPHKLLELLKAQSQTQAVFFQACETSTGVLHDVESLAKTIKNFNPQILVVVDASTALTATEVLTDAWDLDIVLASSQKGFQLPAGLSFLSMSKLGFERMKTSTLPKYYFDLKKEKRANEKDQSAFSSSVALTLALQESLKAFRNTKALLDKIQHTKTLSQLTCRWVQAVGLSIFSESPSPSVSAISLPENIDGEEVKGLLQQKYHLTVAGGQDQLKGKILRIGHLGDMTRKTTLNTLEALGETLVGLGYEISDLKGTLKKLQK